MIERVEKVTPIKETRLRVRRPYREEKESTGGDTFRRMLQTAIEKKAKPPVAPTPIGEAYALDVGRATQSLFYEGKAALPFWFGQVHDVG